MTSSKRSNIFSAWVHLNTVLMYSPQGGTISKRKVFGRGGRMNCRLCPVHGRGGVEGNALNGSAEHLTLRRDHR